ncbi:unnamed protein product [Absidia cylindrospora]
MFQSFNKQDDILKNTEEVPVTVPVYEGQLGWYTEKQKWKWHLFRFDGLSFICLATRKVKLPHDTPIEQDNNDNDNNSHPQLPSPTSPLLATPKHPYTEDSNVVMASHYQLPSWSVNLLQVTSISLLALNGKPQQRNCFCIRTIDKCYLLKTRKHKDLERWLFILTKAWNWTQIQQQHIISRSSLSPPPQIPPLDIKPTCDSTKKINNRPPTPPPHSTKPATATAVVSPSPPQKSQHEYYEPNYTSPILSAEKEKWIDEWRDSLQSMAMPSPIQRPASMSFLPLANQPSSFVKKKRSDEVKNWISSPPPPHGQQDYDVPYFQDVNTTDYAYDTSTHHNSNSNHSGGNKSLSSSPLLHYHRSTRGRNVQIITNNHHQPSPQKPTVDSPTPPFNNHSPLHVLSKAESTHDVYKLQSTTTTRQHPPTTSPMNSSSTKIDQQNQQQQQGHHHGVYYHPQRSSSSIVVAPSLPPVASSYHGSSFLSLKPQCNGSVIFYPSRSTPTHGTPLVDHPHSIAKSSTKSLIPTSPFPPL